MQSLSRTILLATLALSVIGCGKKTDADTVPPGAERGGAGADGNNSAPDSLSDGAPDPDTTPLDQPSTATPEPAAAPPGAAGPP